MNASVIKKLNELNHEFYEKVSDSFSETRQQPWAGWTELLPILKAHISQNSPIVLDIGCGNGRFALFLKKNFPSADFFYYGEDSSQKLLDLAEQSLQKHLIPPNFQVTNRDFLDKPPAIEADIITLFGVLHHVPSKELRIQKIQECADALLPGGILIFTAWQFDQLKNVFERRVSAEKVGLHQNDLEDGDYLLTWERGVPAIRYCHLTTQDEIAEIVSQSGLQLVTQFVADGPNNSTNEYVVLQKI